MSAPTTPNKPESPADVVIEPTTPAPAGCDCQYSDCTKKGILYEFPCEHRAHQFCLEKAVMDAPRVGLEQWKLPCGCMTTWGSFSHSGKPKTPAPAATKVTGKRSRKEMEEATEGAEGEEGSTNKEKKAKKEKKEKPPPKKKAKKADSDDEEEGDVEPEAEPVREQRAPRRAAAAAKAIIYDDDEDDDEEEEESDFGENDSE
ncbi:hypothetical protein BZA77DRAFT_321929 [Pyronema omphalodes]|nr:hypothetical protein BZA77DRAFT_321929 [Pyronema omphalodes]